MRLGGGTGHVSSVNHIMVNYAHPFHFVIGLPSASIEGPAQVLSEL